MDDHKRNLYLQRKYGITLSEYNEMLVLQNNACLICLRPGKTRALAVDHDHKWKQIKHRAWKDQETWHADADYRGLRYLGVGLSKSEAIKSLNFGLLRSSIRGLLCPHCNSGLRKYSDDPARLQRAAEYLRRFAGNSLTGGI